MNKATITDSVGRTYQLVNGTAYNMATPQKVVDILEQSRQHRTRLILDYGDANTGQSWGEVNDIRGHIGRSTGNVKIPLLIKTARSMGGGGVLDHCIVKITASKGGAVLYEHPTYKVAK